MQGVPDGKIRFVVPTLVGLLALVLVVASSFMPWYEWSFPDEPDLPLRASNLWGLPRSLLFPSYTMGATIEIPVEYQRVVTNAAWVYLFLLALNLALWSWLFGIFYRFVKMRGLIAAPVIGFTVLCVITTILGGSGEFILDRLLSSEMMVSTWWVTARLEATRLAGLLTLATGTFLQGVALVWMSLVMRCA